MNNPYYKCLRTTLTRYPNGGESELDEVGDGQWRWAYEPPGGGRLGDTAMSYQAAQTALRKAREGQRAILTGDAAELDTAKRRVTG